MTEKDIIKTDESDEIIPVSNKFNEGVNMTDIDKIRAEIQRRYEHHLGCMEGSRDDNYPGISRAYHCAVKTELFEILCFLDVLEKKENHD